MANIFIFILTEMLPNRAVHTVEGFELVLLWSMMLVSTLGPLMAVVIFLIIRHTKSSQRRCRLRL